LGVAVICRKPLMPHLASQRKGGCNISVDKAREISLRRNLGLAAS
jgi:hypothetical protein